MIESARIRGLINEFRNYKQAIYSFRLAKDRLPGDLNSSGKIGDRSGQIYNDTSFGDPYIESNTKYGVPDLWTAPFVDMYLEKIIDYEPKKISIKSGKLMWDNGGAPNSKVGIGCFVISYVKENETTDTKHYKYQAKPGNYLRWHSSYDQSTNQYHDIKSKYFKVLDQKLDDGVYNSGILRGQCLPTDSTTSYDDAVNCRAAWYFLDM